MKPVQRIIVLLCVGIVFAACAVDLFSQGVERRFFYNLYMETWQVRSALSEGVINKNKIEETIAQMDLLEKSAVVPSYFYDDFGAYGLAEIVLTKECSEVERDLAERNLNIAISLSPLLSMPKLRKAYLFEACGDKEKALQFWRLAIKNGVFEIDLYRSMLIFAGMNWNALNEADRNKVLDIVSKAYLEKKDTKAIFQFLRQTRDSASFREVARMLPFKERVDFIENYMRFSRWRAQDYNQSLQEK